MDELPAEIAELRDLHDTAMSNLAMAEGAHEAAAAEVKAAQDKALFARDACGAAEVAEESARRDYIAALRKHGYVQTADGPRPAEASS